MLTLRRLPATIATLVMATALVLPAQPAVAAPGDSPVGGEQLVGKRKIVNLGPDSDPLPSVWAKTWLVANADTGEIYAAKGPHIQRAPASTLKTLTALTLMPQLDPAMEVTAKKKAVNTYGSKVGLQRGKKYTIEDLYYALLLPSANDAAIALGQANGGVGKTVDQMNSVARSLGATSTVAKNTNGLDSPGQVSTAYDLALIGREAMKIDNFNNIVQTRKYAFPYKKRTKEIYNNNRLVTDGYRGALGVKTGFTTNAGRTFIGAAERKDVTLIVVAMGIKESSATAAGKLMDWAFANKDTVTPIGTLIAPQQITATSAVSSDGNPTEGDPNNGGSAASGFTPSGTSTAGPSTGGTSLDPLAMGWMILFIAIGAFLIVSARSAVVKKRNRRRLANPGRIKLEG
jgi:serine-type D-Ala-D-Ala carboxypeptidase (penicillin-binding protein 5/6)